MTNNAQILTARGFQNVNEIISAAKTTGLPLWIATAFVEKESRGANVYGHDAGGTFSGAGAVTLANYSQFYNMVVNHHGRSNGVGPMQITWPGYLTDAAKNNVRLWVPIENLTYGFKLVAAFLGRNYSTASIAAAGQKYNGGVAYGTEVAQRAAYWHGQLVPDVAPSPAVLKVGSTGPTVRTLQAGLNRVFPAYSNLRLDGVFGTTTERVIVEFQSRSGLLRDGVVGPATRAKLHAVGIDF